MLIYHGQIYSISFGSLQHSRPSKFFRVISRNSRRSCSYYVDVLTDAYGNHPFNTSQEVRAVECVLSLLVTPQKHQDPLLREIQSYKKHPEISTTVSVTGSYKEHKMRYKKTLNILNKMFYILKLLLLLLSILFFLLLISIITITVILFFISY